MAFFCAGSSNEVKKRLKSSKPVSGSKSTNSTVISSNGRVVNPFQDSPKQQKQQQQNQQQQQQQQQQAPGPVTVPHSDSDLNSRKMVVLQEFRPNDSRGLGVRRGELVQVISEEQNWIYVRNERNKEGYVPATNLVAPYSSMRSNRRVLGVTGGGGVPMRHVASGSSIDIKEAPSTVPPIVPMYPSTSAGRPRNFSMGDEHRIRANNCNNQRHPGPPPDYPSGGGGHPGRRGYSPHEFMNGGNITQTISPSDQKYSPSTSSGVASFTGTNSPMGGHSDGSNHSSYCSIEDESRGREVVAGDDGGMAHSHQNHHQYHNGRPNRPHPHHHHAPPTNQPSQLEQQQNDYNISNGGGPTTTEIPPPIPPRTFQPQPPNHSPYPPPPLATPGGSQDSAHIHDEFEQDPDSYACPADAIQKQHNPHLGHPRMRNLNDVRLREIRRTQENGVYSEVFQGPQRPIPRQQQNGYRMVTVIGDDESLPSEGGSTRSRGSSTRRTGSRINSHRTADHYPSPNSYEYEVFSHESDITLSENRGGRPLSANSSNSLNGNGPTKIKKFRKNLWGLYTVTREFEAYDENEVSISSGDHVSVWNQDDRDWYWIVKHDTSEEGFVPSVCLKEIVNPVPQQQEIAAEPELIEPVDTQDEEEEEEVPAVEQEEAGSEEEKGEGQGEKAPPLPPKPPHALQSHSKSNRNAHHGSSRHHPQGGGYDGHVPFRSRAATHDPRSSSNRNPAGYGGFRSRLGSDGSAQSSGRGQSSTTSIDRHLHERSESPPNTPPPPYSEQPPPQHRHPLPPPPTAQHSHTVHGGSQQRHFSLSQQSEPTTGSGAYNTTHMQRTRSHGQVPYRRVNIPPPTRTMAPPSGGVMDSGGQRLISPPDAAPFPLKSPTEMGGGTLV